MDPQITDRIIIININVYSYLFHILLHRLLSPLEIPFLFKFKHMFLTQTRLNKSDNVDIKLFYT